MTKQDTKKVLTEFQTLLLVTARIEEKLYNIVKNNKVKNVISLTHADDKKAKDY